MVLAGLLVAAPLWSLVATSAQARPGEVWTALQRAGLPALALSVVTVATGATAWALAVAVPLAWLAARTDLPARHVVSWLAPLPLAIPPYVAAIAYVFLLAPGGAAHQWVASLAGVAPAAVRWPRAIYGSGGAAFVLGLFTAPSVFLIVYGAASRANPALEEAARSLGLGPWRVFLRVTLPILLPAIVAGGMLVFVYACVDFGVVSLLRARTVTTALYTYLLAGYSRPASSVIALLLVGFVWLALLAQARALGAAGQEERRGPGARARRGAPPVRLGRWRFVALGYCLLLIALGLAAPVLVLVAQVFRLEPARLASFVVDQVPYLRNSVVVAASGATLATALGLVLALARRGVPGAGAAALLTQAGYGIPGTVLGLALVGLLIERVPALYGTPASLALAYVILFAAPAYQACRTAIGQVTPSLENAARGLGSSPWEVLRRVVLPIAGPGLIGGWALAFALAFRELAASIILRPPGYDTLAVRIWVHTMDVGPDPRGAAVALLLLVVVAAVWMVAMVASRAGGGERA